MQQTVEALIKEVKKESQKIVDYIQKKEYISSTFDSPHIFFASATEHDLEKKTKKLRARYGIYLFVMNTDLNISKQQIMEWNKVAGGLIKIFDNIKDITAKANNCFYIGSCYQHSLMTRIREHFSEKKEPASLKLNNNKRCWIKNSLSVYCFPIKKTFTKEQNRIILPAIEKELHNELKAIAGSSRV